MYSAVFYFLAQRASFIFRILAVLFIATAMTITSIAQQADQHPGADASIGNVSLDEKMERLREKMERSAYEDELGFLGKLAKQIEITKDKYVIDVKNASSRREAEIVVDNAKFELLRLLDVCKDIQVLARYIVLGIEKVENPTDSEQSFLIECRLDEPNVDWEERGKKTRNSTRRVERSYFYVDAELITSIKKGDAILVSGTIDVQPSELGGKDQDILPYLYVVSANLEVFSGKLTEAGAKNNRIAKLLLENYSVTTESMEERESRIKAKISASKQRVQFNANAFAEKIESLYEDRKEKLATSKTSAQRDDVLKSFDRAFSRYLTSQHGLTYSLRLIIQDVKANSNGYTAVCTIDSKQENDDFTFPEADGIQKREQAISVSVKENLAKIANPGDQLVVEGTMEVKFDHNNQYASIDQLLSKKGNIPLMKVGKNFISLSPRNVKLSSGK